MEVNSNQPSRITNSDWACPLIKTQPPIAAPLKGIWIESRRSKFSNLVDQNSNSPSLTCNRWQVRTRMEMYRIRDAKLSVRANHWSSEALSNIISIIMEAYKILMTIRLRIWKVLKWLPISQEQMRATISHLALINRWTSTPANY